MRNVVHLLHLSVSGAYTIIIAFDSFSQNINDLLIYGTDENFVQKQMRTKKNLAS